MSNTKTVRRQGQFREGVDSRGVRHTRVNAATTKTHTPLWSGVGEIVLPETFTAREVPAKGDRPAIPYREYRLPVNGGYILVNDMRADNTSCTALISIKEKEMKQGQNTFTVFYLKIEDTDQPATHVVGIASDKSALNVIMETKVDGQLFFDLAVFGHNMSGGIIVTPID